MATILLSAAGFAAGSSLGGTVLGLSTAVVGRAVGAAAGRLIDESLMGAGSEPVETGRVERLRLTGAGEGDPLGRVWGRMRVPGHVIWASEFRETRTTARRGGKGRPKEQEVTEHSYSVSLAIALCEGVAGRVGRVWADGGEIAPGDLDMRFYGGSGDQRPDPLLAAALGDRAPAFRGTAYVVIEDLDIGRWGNRVPQLSFEVMRPAEGDPEGVPEVAEAVRGVCLVPGTGEYALATTPVTKEGPNGRASANVHSASLRTDFATSLEALEGELPNCGSVNLVVSWFGSDLRAGRCEVRPKVEDRREEGREMPWRAGGIRRAEAREVARDMEGRPVYGGTPADGSVIEAIRAVRAAGKEAMFYPFLLMEPGPGNGLTDPWTGEAGQPAYPWRGRITTERAPGVEGTTDRTAAAEAEVAAFFGRCEASDFRVRDGEVRYSGPAEWGWRRMILHYAHLCAAAGGVDAFCVGSEMRSLTQVRGAGDTFPAVEHLRRLAGEVKAILGPGCAVSYAADWSEYFGYHPGDTGNVHFHLDPFWADPNVDFVGIDNYLPLSDWRDGEAHADAAHGVCHDLGYLMGNVEGGLYGKWYYPTREAEAAQRRVPITDGAWGEDWVFRPKAIREWWGSGHHERIGGVRSETATAWVNGMKPVRFTEYGCAAVDKGTNAPNLFDDGRSSESGLPPHSDGRRDEAIQAQYVRALNAWWAANNPVSPVYGGPMLDLARCHLWCWDARPFPAFPARGDIWSDRESYGRGHWLNGRASSRSLAGVVREICEGAGLRAIGTGRLHGLVRGYSAPGGGTARQALQPLMLAHGFDAVERGGLLEFLPRGGRAPALVEEERLVAREGGDLELVRAPEAEVPGRVRLVHVDGEGDYGTLVAQATWPGAPEGAVAGEEVRLALTPPEGRAVAERWLTEVRVARERLSLSLPPSRGGLAPGDVFEIGGRSGRWRIDRAELGAARAIEAVRIEPAAYEPSDAADEYVPARPVVPPLPLEHLFLDLPLLTGEEAPHAPHVAAGAGVWPGGAAVFAADGGDAGYGPAQVLDRPAVMGRLLDPLPRARGGLWDRGAPVRVALIRGELESVGTLRALAGANAAAIGDGSAEGWEVIQFAEATPTAPGEWALSMRLRGQAGTDGIVPGAWPAGSWFVLLDGAPEPLALRRAQRGVERHYRIGPAGRPYDDPSFVHDVRTFRGAGLRPYAPAHLRAGGGADTVLSWVRRTRVDGDGWDGEVPLGEASERWLLRVRQGGAIRREETLEEARFLYTAAMKAADGVDGPFAVEVAQVSDVWGPGPFAKVGAA
ncbi:putative tail protein [Hasllibacter halocynthiae]|uniref:Putative tail protein n=1 Tax=Hasllibacter halocynthiae TaxID=595589 RepID=A0A2T0X8T3_9RHOB|nr:glycoside hydrolase/phage tail family protein [Hasllibacter halocynthiae]PRY95358.1 putative tail protein [Hasllibacter halocynthiae]